MRAVEFREYGRTKKTKRRWTVDGWSPSDDRTVCWLDMRHWERRGGCRGEWRKNPCNTSQCFYGRFLIETSFTDNKHAVSLYKPTPQISVTHSSPDTLSRISQRHTHTHTHTHTRSHTHFQMLYRDKHALPLLLFDIHWHTLTHTQSYLHITVNDG